jgi:hypothetical protein
VLMLRAVFSPSLGMFAVVVAVVCYPLAWLRPRHELALEVLARRGRTSPLSGPRHRNVGRDLAPPGPTTVTGRRRRGRSNSPTDRCLPFHERSFQSRGGRRTEFRRRGCGDAGQQRLHCRPDHQREWWLVHELALTALQRCRPCRGTERPPRVHPPGVDRTRPPTAHPEFQRSQRSPPARRDPHQPH